MCLFFFFKQKTAYEMRISDWSSDVCSSDLAKAVNVTPLCMEATTIDGEQHRIPAINEVSLLRETRQTAKLEVTLNGRIVLPEQLGRASCRERVCQYV